MKHALIVGLGGFVGSIARYLLGLVIQSRTPTWQFPLHTFLINIIGCLLIGLFAGLAERRDLISTELRLLLFTGLCGGFTTFSAFALENLTLLRRGEPLIALAYISLSVILCLIATWIGFKTTAPS